MPSVLVYRPCTFYGTPDSPRGPKLPGTSRAAANCTTSDDAVRRRTLYPAP